MSTGQLLAVAAVGDPRDPATWSGTPANIIAALERNGVDVLGLDTGIRSRCRTGAYFARFHVQRLLADRMAVSPRALNLRSLRTEARSDFHWSRPARSFRSRTLKEQLRTSGCSEVLHMGGLSLPLEAPTSFPKHYLYCDSTWNTLHPSQHEGSRLSKKDRAAAEGIERRALRNVSHFFPTAEYVRADLIEHYGIDPARITVVGTGRGNIEPGGEAKVYRDGFILFCAKVRFEQKGGALLLDAFRRAHAVNDRLRLVIVGDQQYLEMVRGMPGVEAFGSVSWDELQTLFHGAALFAMPALNEPWGLVYLEALASRTPVLGLRRNSLPEITQGGRFGFLVDVPTPEAVSVTLLDAFSDPDRLRRMGDEGQRFCIEHYSWERVAAEISTALERNAA